MTDAVSTTQLTPLSFLDRSAQVFAEKLAVVSDGRSLTYRGLASEVTRVAHALSACGVRAGDRVAYLSPNLPEMLVGHFAVPLAGGVLVAINTRLSAEEICYILDHSGSKVLVVHASLLGSVRLIAELPKTVQHMVVIDDPAEQTAIGGLEVRRYADLLALGSEEPLPWSVSDERSTIAVNYTSGTTGRPKGVMYSHRGAYLNALGEIIHSQHHRDGVYLWTLPMFHCNGWCTAWAVTAVGGRHVCLPAVDAAEIWRLIDTEGITHLNAAPTVLVTMVNAQQAHPLAHPLTATTAGAPPSPVIIRQMEQLGARIVHVYGLTETYGPYSVCEPQETWSVLDPGERAQMQSRQGVGMIQTERLRVVDEYMVDVPRDGTTMGEIVMRGNNVMTGYLDDPDATARAFRGGWFHSGDLGVMYPDGYVELRDRAKDVIISGGENISTIEVEQAVISHPGVLETAVIGIPDDKWGERPKAFVVVRDGIEATEAEIIAHVQSRLARYKAPKVVEFVTELPKTSTGKIRKFELKNKEWAGHDKRIQG
ncbi:MAG: long-chain-fatty-acid--CoA ligase [Actinoallomurus sp.]